MELPLPVTRLLRLQLPSRHSVKSEGRGGQGKSDRFLSQPKPFKSVGKSDMQSIGCARACQFIRVLPNRKEGARFAKKLWAQLSPNFTRFRHVPRGDADRQHGSQLCFT